MRLNECDDSAMTSENNKIGEMIHVKQGNIMGAHHLERWGGLPRGFSRNLPLGPSTPASTPANKLGFIEN